MLKFYKMSTIFDFAHKLALLHQPVQIDDSHRFNRTTQVEAGAHLTRNWKAASDCEPVN